MGRSLPIVTLSISVDVSDSLEEARTRLLRTARALNRAWAAALCSMVVLVLVTLGLLLVATLHQPVYVVIWSVLLAATGYNVTRFWPRRPERRGVLLDEGEVAALRTEIDPQGRVVWPDAVRLVSQAELELATASWCWGCRCSPASTRELESCSSSRWPRRSSRRNAAFAGRSGSPMGTSVAAWSAAAGRG